MKRTNRLDKFYEGARGKDEQAFIEGQEIEHQLKEVMEPLAISLLGDPNPGSRPHDMRYGSKGLGSSLSIDAVKGEWQERNLAECKYAGHPLRGGPIQLIQFVNECSEAEAYAWGRKWLNNNRQLAPREFSAAKIRERSQSDARKQDIALRMIWQDAKGTTGTIGETYLSEVRRLGKWVLEHSEVRYSYNCQHRNERTGEKRPNPALVFLYRDIFTDVPRGIERFYLSSNGRNKADLDPQRSMLGGNMRDAVFKATPHTKITKSLGICEGPIDALSLAYLGWPAWATGGSDKLKSFPVLPGVEKLIVFADNDGAGLVAAEECAKRWRKAGRAVAVAPPDGEKDWNDVLRNLKGRK